MGDEIRDLALLYLALSSVAYPQLLHFYCFKKRKVGKIIFVFERGALQIL